MSLFLSKDSRRANVDACQHQVDVRMVYEPKAEGEKCLASPVVYAKVA
jgi:hypothetical protein